jgi:hypothetical protein
MVEWRYSSTILDLNTLGDWENIKMHHKEDGKMRAEFISFRIGTICGLL